jgi:hypothetical protein
MTHSTRRPFAAATAFAVLVSGLVLTPFAAAPALASTASDAADTATLNSLIGEARSDNDQYDYRTSPSLTAFAKAAAVAYAAKPNSWELNTTKFPKDLETAGAPIAVDYLPLAFTSKTISVANVFEAVLETTDYSLDSSEEFTTPLIASGHFDWAGVSLTRTAKGTFAVITLANYTSSPLETITTVKPKISGTAAVGNTLTAVTGAWKPSDVAFNFQWTIAGEVRGTSPSFVLPDDSLGKTVTLKLSAYKELYKSSAVLVSLPTKKVVKGTFKVTPVGISGLRNVGETLTGTGGGFIVEPLDGYVFAAQWYRGTAKIVGETGQTYKQTTADLGKKISVKITYSRLNYTTYTKQTAVKLVTAAPFLKGTKVPQVTFSTEEINYGTVLTAVPGTWTAEPEEEIFTVAAPVKYAYQWAIDGKAVKGATKSTWTVTGSAVNKDVTVTVTGSLKGYSATKSTSNEWYVYPLTFDTSEAATSISGSFATGKKLTGNITGVNPAGTTYAYAWLLNDRVVGTGKTLTVSKAVFAAGHVELQVTIKRVGYTDAFVYANTGLG